jgi:threonine/homoserine/homoserine lactone efflux protein
MGLALYPLPMSGLALPIDPPLFAAFMLAASAVVISPGPDTIVILRHAMNSGLRTGLVSVAGVQAGLAAHTALAALGLSVVIASAPVLFKAIAVAGALYLGWLGVQGLRAPILTLDGTQVAARTSPADRMSDLYGSGSRILGINPKVILLYLALLPSFVAPELGLPELQLAILGLTIIAINIVWQGFLVAAAGHMRRWLQSDAMQRAVSRATGAILIAFAVAMVWSNLGRNLAA